MTLPHPLVILVAQAILEDEHVNRIARLYPNERLDITIKVANGRIVRCGVYVEPKRGKQEGDDLHNIDISPNNIHR